MEQKQPDMTDTPAAAKGPGAMLRRAREDLRLAPENVASILRLSARQILQLEEDDYASLPGPTYVRGYLRSYAQLLGLSPDRVVDVYQQYCRQLAPPPIETAVAAPTGTMSENAQTARWTAAAVGVVVLLLIVFWWKGRDDSGNTTRKADSTTTYVTESGAVIRDPAAAGGPTESPAAAVSPSAPVSATTPAAQLPRAPAVAPAARPATAAAVKPAVPATPVPAPAAIPAPAATPAAVAAAPATVTPVPAAGPRGRLVLKTTQESWADVRDGRQGRLLYETLAPGRVVTLEGVAPISVFIGNAEGVQLEYNGQPVDIRRHQRGPMARFTLGGETPVAR